jgi:hypothetical protein
MTFDTEKNKEVHAKKARRAGKGSELILFAPKFASLVYKLFKPLDTPPLYGIKILPQINGVAQIV